MSLFNNKTRQKRRRPTADLINRNTPKYNDYYRSESKRTSNSAHSKGSGGGGPTKRIHVNAQARHIPTYIAVTLIIFSLVYSSIISNSVLVIIPTGQGLRDRAYYESVAKTVMQNSVFNKSKFTFDARRFKDNFKKELPEIKDINLSVPLAGKKPVAGVTFVRPLYVFTVSNKKYIVGEDGVILANAEDIISSKKDSLRHITDDAPLEVAVGKPVLLSSDIVFLETMFSDLEKAGITVSSARLPLGAGELYLQPADTKYLIKFSLSGDAHQQVGAYLAIVKNLDVNNQAQEYIDVRLAERVFIK